MHVRYAPRSSPVEATADQLHLATLCLELQLDVLLVALRPGFGPSRSSEEWSHSGLPRWDEDVLDLRQVGPELLEEGSGSQWLQERFEALTHAIDELLDNGVVQQYPTVVTRLIDVRSTCADRMASIARQRVVEPRQLAGMGAGVEAGHFLG